ncbi:tRNA dihydrouridine synthase DusB [Ectothiorhodospira mobilis]|uniref:tRNA dihydrouridine synthase DusB n=1 Tax=Ectothiorhodospira mobilis TaxID=195064 RepID=UPI001EE783B8|nr:tRNA dihydrouridine synthase DusB [Ectothiorhodospira mobilis]MCG5535476.1 tRNA dihydrouridine synthase DusB [Ectothiorhodospira mobilis]
MRIGPHTVDPPLILAPMAGISDLPFRRICRRQGAGLAVSEMVHADTRLWHTQKSRLRLHQSGEPDPRSVQITGREPAMMAAAARAAVERGAGIIDLNMGCPARKVMSKAAGAALLGDEARVRAIMEAVVAAVHVPVTLKIRLGLDRSRINAPVIARIAQDCGVQALTVHGRTAACSYQDPVDAEAIARVRETVSIPVIANGDLFSPEDALRMRAITGADALMVGRGARGRPWIFRRMARALETGEIPPEPGPETVLAIVREHLQALYGLHGPRAGVQVARKHIGWYLQGRPGAEAVRRALLQAEDPATQLERITRYFETLPPGEDIAA